MQGAHNCMQLMQVKISSYGLGSDGPLNCSTVGSSINDVCGEHIPFRQSPWKETLPVAFGTGAESHESVLLLCCAKSWLVGRSLGLVMINVDGFVEHC